MTDEGYACGKCGNDRGINQEQYQEKIIDRIMSAIEMKADGLSRDRVEELMDEYQMSIKEGYDKLWCEDCQEWTTFPMVWSTEWEQDRREAEQERNLRSWQE